MQTGKKITDDLAEVRDKMHELTWHLFDDHTYVMRHPNAVFFNDLKKGRIKSQDPSKEMDKYLHVSGASLHERSNSDSLLVRWGNTLTRIHSLLGLPHMSSPLFRRCTAFFVSFELALTLLLGVTLS
jgi:hypothetical protein